MLARERLAVGDHWVGGGILDWRGAGRKAERDGAKQGRWQAFQRRHHSLRIKATGQHDQGDAQVSWVKAGR